MKNHPYPIAGNLPLFVSAKALRQFEDMDFLAQRRGFETAYRVAADFPDLPFQLKKPLTRQWTGGCRAKILGDWRMAYWPPEKPPADAIARGIHVFLFGHRREIYE